MPSARSMSGMCCCIVAADPTSERKGMVRKKGEGGLVKYAVVCAGLWLACLAAGLYFGYWNAFAVVGGAAWLFGAVCSGALLSGDRIRANHATETAEDRKQRLKWAGRFFLIGLPFVVTAIFLYG
jgi:hypothetical protein